MAHLHTGVFSAVEQGTALPVALQHGSLATAHRLTDFPTYAGFCYESRALGTRSRVTQNVAGVVAVEAAPFLAAHVAAAVGNLTALPLWVGHFATEAGVGGGVFQGDVLTGRTSPAFIGIVSLGGRGSSPFLDAVEVEDVEAALAAPNRGHVADDVTAHHALILLLRQLFNQTPCLRLFALWHLVPVPLAWPLALRMCPPASSGLGARVAT